VRCASATYRRRQGGWLRYWRFAARCLLRAFFPARAPRMPGVCYRCCCRAYPPPCELESGLLGLACYGFRKGLLYWTSAATRFATVALRRVTFLSYFGGRQERFYARA